jgi:methylthioxylose transferase
MALAVFLTWLILWPLNIPLGIPGEWVWERAEPNSDLLFNLALVALAAGLHYVFVGAGLRALYTAGKAQTGIWVSLLALASFSWLWIVQDSGTPATSLGKTPFVLYYEATSGYFFQARYEVTNTAEFLANYDAMMAQGDVLHIGTHPPGLFLWFRWLGQLVDQSPALVTWAKSLEPETVREAFAVLAKNTAITNHPLTPNDRAILWLSALAAQALAALAVIPLFLLVRELTTDECRNRTAWLAAAYWPTAPAVAIFLPKSDAIFPTFALVALWLVVRGLRTKNLGYFIAASTILWLGMIASLAFLPIALIAAATIAQWYATTTSQPPSPPRSPVSRLVFPLAISAATFALLTFLFSWFCSLNLPFVWSWNYHNHAGFYTQFTRTYWKWLLATPIEITFALGLPVVSLAIWKSSFALRQLLERPQAQPAPVNTPIAPNLARVSFPPFTPAIGFVVTCFAIVALLWITGKNSGEAARLWLIFMPLFLVALGTIEGQPLPPTKQRPSPTLEEVGLIVLAAQLAVSALTVSRIAGFQFTAS